VSNAPRLLLGLCLIGGLATQLAAQLKSEVPTGTRIKRDPDAMKGGEGRAGLAEVAECAVKKHRDKAVGFVLDPSRLDPSNEQRKAADGWCLADVEDRKNADVIALTMPEDVMRFAFAEALVAADLQGLDPGNLKLAQPLAYPVLNPSDYTPKPNKKYKPKQLEDLNVGMERDKTRIAFYQYGECVVRTEPLGVSQLLKSKTNSADEAASIRALMPVFSGCLPVGQQFKSNRTMMRGTIALAYYRLANAPRALALPNKANK
jgi:hypothetical protein